MRRAAFAILLVLAAFPTSGCRSGTSGLDVRYPEAGANRSMLASVAPRRIEVAAVTDRRMDQRRIGYKPKSGADIVTDRPVTDIVREALAVELGANGHAVVGDSKDATVVAAVEEFWLDVVAGYSTTQYVGKVAIALAVADGGSGDTLITRRYVGIKRRHGDADDATVWREVMDAALARTMHDLATDPDVVAALGRLPSTERPR
jgi:uncharacterized lipoprotein YajG